MQMTKAHCAAEEPKLSAVGIKFDPTNSAAKDQTLSVDRGELELASFSNREKQPVSQIANEKNT